jgi:RHS repeat-associated protein
MSHTQPPANHPQRDLETGFLHLRARAYDPSTGRFQQRDPVAGAGRVPTTLNRYAYVLNNPVNHVDPSGQQAVAALPGLGVGVGIGVGTLGLGAIAFGLAVFADTGVALASEAGMEVHEAVVFFAKRTKWTDRERVAKKRLGLTDEEFGEAIHSIKQGIEGNPDMEIDTKTGDVRVKGSEDIIGNLNQELGRDVPKDEGYVDE